jgi:hypothetical protein
VLGPVDDGSKKRRRRRNRRSYQTPRREYGVRFVVSAHEHAILSAAAQREGLALGAFAAQAAMAAAQARFRPEYAVLRELLAELMHASGQVRRIGVNLNQAVAALHSTGSPPEHLAMYAHAASKVVNRLDSAAEAVRARLP